MEVQSVAWKLLEAKGVYYVKKLIIQREKRRKKRNSQKDGKYVI